MRNKKHAERRAQIEAERAERRRAEAERERLRHQKRKSSSIEAKWFPAGKGIRLGGVAIRGGRFYAGANMSSMIEPRCPEPSLLDPREPVGESSEGAQPLGSFPCYEYLTEQQRRKYIEFLASDRTECDDIGYVFIYLYGFERRLIVDAGCPDMVSDEEREELTEELCRLLDVFGSRSRSLAHYIGMLLLYDGTAFEIYDEESINALFHRGLDDEQAWMKRFEYTENASAMSYLMLTRLVENGMEPSIDEIAAFARARLAMSAHFPSTGISLKELYDPAYWKLLKHRLGHVNLDDERKKKAGRRVDGARLPEYFTSSPTLRANLHPSSFGAVSRRLTEEDYPLRFLADVALACRRDLDVAQGALASSALRGIDEVSFDAIGALLAGNNYVQAFLEGHSTAAYVPVSVFEEAAAALGTSLSYTAKGLLTQASQHLITRMAASCGWQAVLPDIIECRASSAWKCGADNDVTVFERGARYDQNSGRQAMGAVFGHDERECTMTLPGKWDDPIALAYIYAWFLKRSSESLSIDDARLFSADHLPPFVEATSQSMRNNQIKMFFAIMYTTYGSGLSTHGIKNCLDAVPFSSVQDLMFSICNEKFAQLVPQDVMEAMESLYSKAGLDKTMVLYDYHAGDYRVSHDKAVEEISFSIDAEKLAETISDTSDVHVILNDAMLGEDEEEYETFDDEEAGSEPAAPESGSVESEVEVISEDRIEQHLFGGSDEIPTSDLVDNVKEYFGLATTNEAMNKISEINGVYGDIIEIDGPDAYLDI